MAVSLLGACGPLPVTLPGAKDAGADGGIQPTLEDLQAKVFSPSCSFASCHGGMSPAGNLDLSNAAKSHMELVGIGSIYGADGGMLLVDPGHPESSFLVTKLERSDAQLQSIGHGRRMPQGNPQVTEEARAAVRTWISNGAAAN